MPVAALPHHDCSRRATLVVAARDARRSAGVDTELDVCSDSGCTQHRGRNRRRGLMCGEEARRMEELAAEERLEWRGRSPEERDDGSEERRGWPSAV